MAPSKALSDNKFLLIYGSQTGQSQAIAEELKSKCETSNDLQVELHCMSKAYKSFHIEGEKLVVLIISTTGDGEYPDNAGKLVRRLKKRTLPKDHLSGVKYALLALGDSNYTSFCNAGKNLNKRLKELGAQSILPLACADDAVGLEIVAEPWMDNVIVKVREELNLPVQKPIICAETTVMEGTTLANLIEAFKDISLSVPGNPKSYLKVTFSNANIEKTKHPHDNFPLPSAASDVLSTNIVSLKKLTDSELVKETYELTLKVLEDVTYEPGDSFSFLCNNSDIEVNEILSRLNVEEEKIGQTCLLTSNDEKKQIPKHLPSKSTLFHILSKCCEIRCQPKKAFLRVLAENTSSEDEKRKFLILCSRQGAAYYTHFVREERMTLLDFLKMFPTCKPTPEVILEHLPALQPRSYSVTSSPLTHPQEISFVFNVIKMKGTENSTAKRGVCTGFLSQLYSKNVPNNDVSTSSLTELLKNLSFKNEEKILIYKRTNSNHFKLPQSLSTPLIMIGPGTGMAPYLGFLRHRQKLIEELKRDSEEETEIGETWLFYGCRYKNLDYIYKEELEELKSLKILNHLCVSFSREEDSVIKYVQDNIREHSTPLFVSIIDQDASIFICGDAKNMAKDVRQAFKEEYLKYKSCDEAQSEDFLQYLIDQKRYLQDIWA